MKSGSAVSTNYVVYLTKNVRTVRAADKANEPPLLRLVQWTKKWHVRVPKSEEAVSATVLKENSTPHPSYIHMWAELCVDWSFARRPASKTIHLVGRFLIEKRLGQQWREKRITHGTQTYSYIIAQHRWASKIINYVRNPKTKVFQWKKPPLIWVVVVVCGKVTPKIGFLKAF